MIFLWLKALHIIFVITWFAGLFYLPRIFVNIALVKEPSVQSHLIVMAQKLYRFMTPLMLLAIGFGIALSWLNWDLYKVSAWYHIKMGLLLLLFAYHGFCGYYLKQFQQQNNNKNHVFFRFFNEAPVLLLFAIVLLAVLKP